MSRTGAKTHRVDANAPDIIRRMRAAGIAVESTAQVGGGFPDAVWYFRDKCGLIEFKMPGESLNAAQRDFAATWPGHIIVARDAEEAILAVVEAARPRPTLTAVGGTMQSPEGLR